MLELEEQLLAYGEAIEADLVAQHPSPAIPASPRRRARRLVVAAAALVVLAMASATVWTTLDNSDDDGRVTTATTPTGASLWDAVGTDAWSEIPVEGDFPILTAVVTGSGLLVASSEMPEGQGRSDFPPLTATLPDVLGKLRLSQIGPSKRWVDLTPAGETAVQVSQQPIRFVMFATAVGSRVRALAYLPEDEQTSDVYELDIDLDAHTWTATLLQDAANTLGQWAVGDDVWYQTGPADALRFTSLNGATIPPIHLDPSIAGLHVGGIGRDQDGRVTVLAGYGPEPRMVAWSRTDGPWTEHPTDLNFNEVPGTTDANAQARRGIALGPWDGSRFVGLTGLEIVPDPENDDRFFELRPDSQLPAWVELPRPFDPPCRTREQVGAYLDGIRTVTANCDGWYRWLDRDTWRDVPPVPSSPPPAGMPTRLADGPVVDDGSRVMVDWYVIGPSNNYRAGIRAIRLPG